MSDNPLQHLSPIWSRAFSVMVDHGEGPYLFDTEGKRYLDFTCGIGVTNTGHAHPRVVKAIQEQAAKLIHGQANIVYHKPMLELIDQLLTVVPQPLDSFFFSNSGAEIVEAGVKLAKQVTGRPNVIVFQGSFHGRTHLTMAMTTSKTVYRAGHQPLVPGIFAAPYPYGFYYGWDEQTTLDFCLHELNKLLKSQTAPEETACIVVEPVLGEGGYVVPPAGFMPALRKLCDEHGILLVADEIQSGFGRTGKFFAVEHTRTIPDILLMAKGIASGLPLSGLAARRELMAKWKPGSHGGTFGGNPVACAAAVATIQTMREEKLVQNASARGAQLMAGLRKLQTEFPSIGDVRGLGLMVGVEFGKPGAPDTTTAKAVDKAAFERGLMLLTCGTFDNVIRWIPPLVVKEEQIAEALRIFASALDRVASA
jgi:4-aminobutyrate aminotransferase